MTHKPDKQYSREFKVEAVRLSETGVIVPLRFMANFGSQLRPILKVAHGYFGSGIALGTHQISHEKPGNIGHHLTGRANVSN